MQKSKEGRIRNHSGHLDHLGQNKPPAAVNIDDMLDEDIGDISSSSEIEIDEPLGKFAAKTISKRDILKFLDPANDIKFLKHLMNIILKN